MSGQISEKPVLTELCTLLSRSVSSESLQRARLHLLDWIGCAAAGAVEPVGQVLRSQSPQDAETRTFIWGGLGNVLEMDDVDKRALLHPGPSIVPAALSVAQAEQSEISDLLSALVRGYEATIRLGRAVGAGHYALWHTTGTCGPIGAAVAAAELNGLTQEETEHAMALALSQAAGLWHNRHDPESMGKQMHTANAARAGVQAARLAKAGMTGPLRILEGEQGFFAAMCPDGDPKDLLTDTAKRWCIHDVSFKPWPACRHAHAVIDAALELRDHFQPKASHEITVRTYSDALKFCDRLVPKTVIEAKFSLQHAVAIVLTRGLPKLEDFQPDAIEDPEIRALREKVNVEVSPVFDAAYPARFGAEVSLGETVTEAPDALGDPENPMSETQIRAKAEMLMRAGGFSTEQTDAIISDVLNADGPAMGLIKKFKEAFA